MIVVDTSALVAVLRNEPEASRFAEVLASGPSSIGAPTRFELLMVMLRRFGEAACEDARLLLRRLEVAVVPWDEALSDAALDAFLRFGKSRHPAALNFGDCMAYALAKSLDARLLFKGGGFALTDAGVAA